MIDLIQSITLILLGGAFVYVAVASRKLAKAIQNLQAQINILSRWQERDIGLSGRKTPVSRHSH